jgi:hypothetical protein
MRWRKQGPGVVLVARHTPHVLTAVHQSGEMKDGPVLKSEAVE